MGPERVEAWIREHGLDWRLARMPGPARTVEEAAQRLGVDKGGDR